MKFNINILYWIAMVGLIFYYAYTKGWVLADFKSISAKEAYHLLENDDNATLLDVRTQREFQGGHIPNAKLIPLDLLNDNLSKLKKERGKKIIVYCLTGSRSVRASRILKADGFTPINMSGGYVSWVKEKLPIER
ncbi:Rhodanese-like domain protein [hydrothermal vent metagenome]|uniref:Rhodanese-like domain protein n=1 Tax=hydrothermal vent metagenome TaxID=652676 RepID=A0A1W1BPI9_9ZZZZ